MPPSGFENVKLGGKCAVSAFSIASNFGRYRFTIFGSCSSKYPPAKYSAAIAWLNVLVCRSTPCFTMTSHFFMSGGATQMPSRKPGARIFDIVVTYSTCSGAKLRIGGSGSPRYRSALYGSSSISSASWR